MLASCKLAALNKTLASFATARPRRDWAGRRPRVPADGGMQALVQPMPRQALDASRKRKAAITELVDKAIPGAPQESRGAGQDKNAGKP